MTQRRHISWPHEIAPPLTEIDLDDLYRNDVTDPLSGVEHVRRYWPFGKMSGNPFFMIDHEETDDLDLVNDVIDRLEGRGSQFWFPEPINRFHRDIYCGQGDGVRTTFLVPILPPVGTASFRRESLGGLKNYVTFENGNLVVADDEAAMIAGTGGLEAVYDSGSATIVRDSRLAYYGPASARVTASGSPLNAGLKTSAVPVVAGVTYWGLGWVTTANSVDFLAEIEWLDGGGTPILPNTVGTGVAANTGQWVPIAVQGTAPVGAVEARLICRGDGTVLYQAWYDCLGITSYKDPWWWIPSGAPQVVVFAFVVADAEDVYCSVDARRMFHVRMTSDKISRKQDAMGNLIFRADVIEVWEAEDDA